MSTNDQPSALFGPSRALWVQGACVTAVCFGAAYVSYRHGRDFAWRFGADETSATLWPLIVDGMMTTATVELWKTHHSTHRPGSRWAAWLAFLTGVTLSLCANIAAAPEMSVFAVAVAACPPVALLLSVELLNSALKRHRAETATTSNETTETSVETREHRLVRPEQQPRPDTKPTAEQQMWTYYQWEQAKGRTPTGAELDHIAGTNNYGRRVLRKWHTTGRITLQQTRPDHTTAQLASVAGSGQP